MFRYRSLFLIILLGVAPRPAAAMPPGAEALVLIMGDQHSAYARTAQFVGLVDRLKADHPGLPLAVLIDGDSFEYGNVIARRSGGTVDFAMFGALAARAPTVLNLGNHEPEFFDLTETVRRVEATGVTVIGNLINRATGRPFAPASTRLMLGGESAVIVGLTTDKLSTYRVAVRPSLDLADPVVWANARLPALLATAPLSIVLSHAGIAADREILPVVPDGTLFAGAHDHQCFVHPDGRTVYVHSGAWNSNVSLAWRVRAADGTGHWAVEQRELRDDDPAEPTLAALIRTVTADHLTPEDQVVVAHTDRAYAPAEAARFMARLLRLAAGAEAAFIGNTTFGAGLPAGAVTRREFDDCVRFDGTVQIAEVSGARLRQLLAAANLGPDTPFAERRGEFNRADGPADIDPAKTYRIATNDWGARNTARYFGEPTIAWSEQTGLNLKAGLLAAWSR